MGGRFSGIDRDFQLIVGYVKVTEQQKDKPCSASGKGGIFVQKLKCEGQQQVRWTSKDRTQTCEDYRRQFTTKQMGNPLPTGRVVALRVAL